MIQHMPAVYVTKLQPKPSLKIRTVNWNYHGVFRDYDFDHIILGKNFYVFQDRKLKLSAFV